MRVLTVFGTRPEAIKLAPVCHALQARSELFDSRIAVTAQHRGLLDSVLRDFELRPAYDLNVMRENQDLFHITVEALAGMRGVLD
ncbi:MAG: UDP-N-acetylglucosamine 2-epimerase (non-hydrolyzing), partial [Gammaproteobacteria bacterium]